MGEKESKEEREERLYGRALQSGEVVSYGVLAQLGLTKPKIVSKKQQRYAEQMRGGRRAVQSRARRDAKAAQPKKSLGRTLWEAGSKPKAPPPPKEKGFWDW